MKPAALLTSVLLMVLAIAACSPNGKKNEQIKVKCPSCGYEFKVPVERY